MRKSKIGIIGAGDIGFNLAENMALKGHNVIIYNRYHAVDGKPSPYWLSKMGTVMDMNDSLQLPNCGQVTLSSELDDLNGVEICVITAGAKRTSIDETREELASKNALIIKGFASLLANNPNMLALIISNPVDFLTQYLIEQVSIISKKNKSEESKRIVGVSYIDTMRLKNLVREFLHQNNINLENPKIEGIAIGEHGPSMVPLISTVSVAGHKLSHYANAEQIESIFKQTVLRGNDIIKLTGASSVLGPSHAVMHMIDEILHKERATIPCSVWDGSRAIGRVVEFENHKVLKIDDFPLDEKEKELLKKSEETLDKQYKNILKFITNLD